MFVGNGKILVILTGGTICSVENASGERYSHAEEIRYKIVDTFKNSDSRYSQIEFECEMPLNILSENMTVDSWNRLLSQFVNLENCGEYDGIIILHGTDTLAYTSSLLSIMLTHLTVPVVMVSSQLPLGDPAANGNDNFRAAAELIMNGIKPNVYAVYKNSDGKMYLHKGAHLEQCKNYSNDFFSRDAQVLGDGDKGFESEGIPFQSENSLLYDVCPLKNEVLAIVPYVGINYNFYNIGNVKAVVHNTYHSDTVCVERNGGKGEVSENSLLWFSEKCKKNNIDLFLAPCNGEAYAYESTGDALRNGALSVSGMTFEMSYVKTLVGVSRGLKGAELSEFVNTPLNGEIL